MLKNIGDFKDHEAVIDSAKEISRWLYNHGKLYTMMKNAIGGNLVKWNATRFGTNYIFLESFLRKKEAFMQWMASSELLQSKYLDLDAGKYAHAALSSLQWWDSLKRVVDSVQPLYAFLRFADQDKFPNFSEVLLRYHILKIEYESLFRDDRAKFNEYMDVVNRRMHDVANGTYMNAGMTLFYLFCCFLLIRPIWANIYHIFAAGALHPRAHYGYGMGSNQMNALREAFERMADIDTAAEALSEAQIYRTKGGSFSSELAKKMACDGKTSPGIDI